MYNNAQLSHVSQAQYACIGQYLDINGRLSLHTSISSKLMPCFHEGGLLRLPVTTVIRSAVYTEFNNHGT